MNVLSDSRFDRLSRSVQPIFYLARLFPYRIEWAWVTRCIAHRGAPELVLQAQVVPCGPSYLRHIGLAVIQPCLMRSRHVGGKGTRLEIVSKLRG